MADKSACYEETFPKPEREGPGDASSLQETNEDTKNVANEVKTDTNIESGEGGDAPPKVNPWRKPTTASESLFQASADHKFKKAPDGKGGSKSSKRQIDAKSKFPVLLSVLPFEIINPFRKVMD